MTLITRFGIVLVVAAATLPFVLAKPVSSSCKSNEFWYGEKSSCLPIGGPFWRPEPPPEKQCPPNGWSWSREHSCCVPHYPHPPSHHPPQCPGGWDWSPATFCCEPSPHKPYPPYPQPSYHSGWKRDHSDPSSCKKNEFWYEKRGCLLRGGPHSHSAPPPDKQCPPRGWSWSNEHGGCIPHQPRPHYNPSPQCPSDWQWSFDNLWCERPHQYPPPPYPSGRGNSWKRSLPESPSPQLCPMGLTACPIAIASGLSGDFECLDTTNELESCGGCASINEGQDCTAIEGAWNVGCEQGVCAVYTCAPGFKRSADGRSCLPI